MLIEEGDNDTVKLASGSTVSTTVALLCIVPLVPVTVMV
jgi:hypothetical protein